jgi:ferredoxin/flavodoxin---NADP+ reductase
MDCTRNTSFPFENGQFTMVGLEVEGRALMRAYCIASASANYEDTLEFFSIRVPNGPLTSRLQHLGKKPSGTLIVDNLLPGKTL